jgi:hypothetical protein
MGGPNGDFQRDGVGRVCIRLHFVGKASGPNLALDAAFRLKTTAY